LIIQCSKCQARYNYDDSRFGWASTKKIKCTKCATIFEIRNPAAPAPRPASPALAEDFSLDETALTEVKHERRGLPAIPGSVARAQPLLSGEPPVLAPAIRPKGPEPIPVSGSFESALNTDKISLQTSTGSSDAKLGLPDDYRLSLACIAGPDAGRIFEIDKPRVVIGRANADIVVADIQCSRHHAALEVQDDVVTLVDMGSTNGTYVGDLRITRVKLENRGEFEIGSTTLMLIRSAIGTPSGVS
jgi:predicted Zn finger-like uncharacterized protein